MRWTSMRLRGGAAGRSPTGLIPAYGSELFGFHRGSHAFFAEPIDAWLAVLADSVPLHQRCRIVCPSTMTHRRISALTSRARQHFPDVEVLPLQGLNTVGSGATSYPASTSTAVVQRQGGPSAQSSPRAFSPLESVPQKSVDVVVYTSNVVGNEVFYDAPWHVSMAHRVLKPHGVLAIVGCDPLLYVQGPESAAEDVRDFNAMMLDALRSAAQRDSSSGSSGGRVSSESAHSPAPGSDDFVDLSLLDSQVGNRQDAEARDAPDSISLRVDGDDAKDSIVRVLQETESMREAHADMYFPFRATQRRWFDSMYELTPNQYVSAVRASALYQAYASLSSKRSVHDPVNVHRSISAVDPLQALHGCFEAARITKLHVLVRHFVVTCSNRSMNQRLDVLSQNLPRNLGVSSSATSSQHRRLSPSNPRKS